MPTVRIGVPNFERTEACLDIRIRRRYHMNIYDPSGNLLVWVGIKWNRIDDE